MENNESKQNVTPPQFPTPAAAPAPASMAPPPLVVPARAVMPEKKKGRGWMIAALVLLCILAGSLLLNFVSAVGGLDSLGLGGPMHTAGPNLVEVMIENHNAADKIAVINVEGIISGGMGMGDLDMVRLIREQLKRAKADKRVKAVVLRIDSPGGEVLAAESIYADIKKFQEETQKPVVACMGSLAASGGYYVAAPCRWIVAHELTITGSIGVIMHGYNYRGLMNKVGLRPEVYKSGKFKDMLSGDKDIENMTAEERELYLQERAMVQALINEAFDTFKDRVKTGRAKAAELNRAANLRRDWADYADGRILSGRQALQYGFVDQNGTFEDAVNYAAKLTGIPKANLVTYGVPFDLSNILRLLGKSEPPSLKVDLGVNVPQLKTGRLYYLSPVWPY